MVLLLDDCLIKGDQDANEAADENARWPTVKGGVDPRNVLEVYEAAKGVVLLVDHIGEERLDDIERQRIKGVIEVRSVAPSRPRLAGQIEEISCKQRDNKARKGPQSRRSPERARQEQEQIRDLHRVVRLAVDLGHRDREGVAVSEQLVPETVRLEEDDENFDADDRAERFARCLCRLHDA